MMLDSDSCSSELLSRSNRLNSPSSVALACLALLTASSAANAQLRTWNVNGGSWITPSNWSPSNVPDTPAESALIGGTNSFTITTSVSVPLIQINSLRITNPNATLNLAGGVRFRITGTEFQNNGTVRIHANTTTLDARLEFAESLTLAGTGRFIMNDDGSDSQINSLAGAFVTNGSTHSIEGAGDLNARLINLGTVRANKSGEIMSLETNNKVNFGLMEARNNGTLQFALIDISQGSAGEIRADGGTVLFDNFNSSGNLLSGGLVSSMNGGVAVIDRIAIWDFLDVTNAGDLHVLASGELDIQGDGLTNNGLVIINPPGSGGGAVATFAVFEENGTLKGNGVLRLGATGSFSQLNTVPGVTMTQAAEHTIEGRGHLNALLINNGTVRAGSGNVQLTLQTHPKTNNNLFTTAAFSRLQLNNIVVTNGPSGWFFADSGTVQFLSGTSKVIGGRFESNSSTATGRFEATTSSSIIELESVLNNADVRIVAGAQLLVSGTGLTNNNTILINHNNSTSADAELRFVQTGSLSGTGSVVLVAGGDHAQVNTDPSVMLTNEAPHVIRGKGVINAAMTNNGVIRADQASATLTLTMSDKVNNGLIEARDGGVIDVRSTTISGSGALRSESGEIHYSNGATIDGALLLESDAGFHHHISATTIARFADIVNKATVLVPGGSTIEIDGTGIINDGLIRLNHDTTVAFATLQLVDNVVLNGRGAIEMTDGGESVIESDFGVTGTNGSDHTISGRGQINASLVNEGTIRADVTGEPIELATNDKTNNGSMIGANGGRIEVIVIVDGSGDWIGEGGEIQSLAGGQIDTTGDVRMISGKLLADIGSVKAARFLLDAAAAIEVNNAILETTSAFDFRMTNEADWAFDAASDFVLSGGSDATSCNSSLWTTFEVGSTDNGSGGTGTNNFGVADLIIADNAVATLMDLRDNGNRGGGSEALYATSLTLGTGATLNLNGLKLYAGGVDITPGALGGGTVIDTPVVLAGDLNGDSEIDGDDIQGFVNVLFGTDTTPSHVCAADFNNDGFVNAADAAIFSNLLVNP